jgi:hypothetical protein
VNSIAVVASGFHNRRSFPSCGSPITPLREPAAVLSQSTKSGKARNQMQRSGLGLMVRPETSMVSRCPTQAPSSFRKPGSGKAADRAKRPDPQQGSQTRRHHVQALAWVGRSQVGLFHAPPNPAMASAHSSARYSRLKDAGWARSPVLAAPTTRRPTDSRANPIASAAIPAQIQRTPI